MHILKAHKDYIQIWARICYNSDGFHIYHLIEKQLQHGQKQEFYNLSLECKLQHSFVITEIYHLLYDIYYDQWYKRWLKNPDDNPYPLDGFPPVKLWCKAHANFNAFTAAAVGAKYFDVDVLRCASYLLYSYEIVPVHLGKGSWMTYDLQSKKLEMFT